MIDKIRLPILTKKLFVVVIALAAGFIILGSGSISIQLALGGLFASGLYIVVSLGLVLVFSVMKAVNVAHGDFVILASYITFWLYVLYGIDPFLSLVVSVPLFYAIGIIIQKYVWNPTLKYGFEKPMLMAFGLGTALEYLMLYAWTSDPRGLTTSYSKYILQIGSISIPILRLVIFVISLVVIVALYLFIHRTYTGMSFRATSQDRECALLMGIPVAKVNINAFALSLALGAVAGSLISMVSGWSPTLGITYLFKAFVIIVLGGLGSIPGTLIGAIILGLAESYGAYFFGTAFRDLIAYVIFLAIIIWRPFGILGKPGEM